MRLPAGLVGSKANSIPETSGKVPSNFGNLEMEFSNASCKIFPIINNLIKLNDFLLE